MQLINEIFDFDFESDYLQSIAIEFDLFGIDSLGHFLSLRNDIGINFSYSLNKFVITFLEFFLAQFLLIFAQVKSRNLKLALSFDRPIKKLNTKNKFTRTEGQKIILNPNLPHNGIKGKENQLALTKPNLNALSCLNYSQLR